MSGDLDRLDADAVLHGAQPIPFPWRAAAFGLAIVLGAEAIIALLVLAIVAAAS